MFANVEVLDVLKWIATLLSLTLSGRKIYRWIRKYINKQKPTA